MEPTKLETTYSELRNDDVLIDKSGGHWHVSGVEQDGRGVMFWLGDARTKVRAHHMTKPAGDPVTVLRVELLRDTVEKLEAGWPKPDPSTSPTARDKSTNTTSSTSSGLARTDIGAATTAGDYHEAAVAAVEQEMPGAVVDTDSTAAEIDAAAAATDDEPVVLPLFERMTDLEQRSHMFVLHGVFTEDVEDRLERLKLHAAAHRDAAAGKLKTGRHTPHVHSESVAASGGSHEGASK